MAVSPSIVADGVTYTARLSWIFTAIQVAFTGDSPADWYATERRTRVASMNFPPLPGWFLLSDRVTINTTYLSEVCPVVMTTEGNIRSATEVLEATAPTPNIFGAMLTYHATIQGPDLSGTGTIMMGLHDEDRAITGVKGIIFESPKPIIIYPTESKVFSLLAHPDPAIAALNMQPANSPFQVDSVEGPNANIRVMAAMNGTNWAPDTRAIDATLTYDLGDPNIPPKTAALHAEVRPAERVAFTERELSPFLIIGQTPVHFAGRVTASDGHVFEDAVLACTAAGNGVSLDANNNLSVTGVGGVSVTITSTKDNNPLIQLAPELSRTANYTAEALYLKLDVSATKTIDNIPYFACGTPVEVRATITAGNHDVSGEATCEWSIPSGTVTTSGNKATIVSSLATEIPIGLKVTVRGVTATATKLIGFMEQVAYDTEWEVNVQKLEISLAKAVTGYAGCLRFRNRFGNVDSREMFVGLNFGWTADLDDWEGVISLLGGDVFTLLDALVNIKNGGDGISWSGWSGVSLLDNTPRPGDVKAFRGKWVAVGADAPDVYEPRIFYREVDAKHKYMIRSSPDLPLDLPDIPKNAGWIYVAPFETFTPM